VGLGFRTPTWCWPRSERNIAGANEDGEQNMPYRLSRERLFENVWETPIGTLARDWGITSSKLRDICKALHVPLPDVGHWAAVRAGKAPPQPEIPFFEGSSTLTFDIRPRESLIQWEARDVSPVRAPRPKADEALPRPSAPEATKPRYIPVSAWATLVFGEHAPHKNTLLRWVRDGRIQPQPKKIGRIWWTTPAAEYVGD
jgi:hypothetical protein